VNHGMWLTQRASAHGRYSRIALEEREMVRRACLLFAVYVVVALGNLPAMAVAAEAGTRIPASRGAYVNVSAPVLKEMLARKDFVLVNVHVPYEGEIVATDTFIPFNEIDQQISRLPSQKDAKMVLYCMSDRMSTIAAEKLVQLGYTNVWNLDGGMVSWKAKGYPLIQQGRR